MFSEISEITSTDPMRHQVNHDLMVRWINADLFERCGCDVRRSVVCYDADAMFIYAFPAGHQPTDDEWQILHDAGAAKWSRGIV